MAPARRPAVSPVAELIPDKPSLSLDELRSLAAGCTGCNLYKDATQTAFGEGSRSAEVMLVGEQPGDKEDLEGEAFVADLKVAASVLS